LAFIIHKNESEFRTRLRAPERFNKNAKGNKAKQSKISKGI